MEPDGNSGIVPKKLLLRDRSAPVGLRVVTARRAASHWGHAEKRASRIRRRRFGESSFVALIHLPVALLFAYYHHAIENAQTRFVRSPWM